ncbi:glycoside hydrolase family 10 [Fibrella aestuarina BUZ 2]|uniref:Beta-xylanase n=1 Tax=Fibrella aestuarina BUZ 2 TaxID=1166018 RepID=I0K8A3_9BACT|nr:endo-1,4-beta-xylanase [Fibrella aestuarina]CCH00356.1 glycoside hydrolase family 10 [Fibrella aestuarina BUZ 2]
MTSLKTITLLTLLTALSAACRPDTSEFVLAKPESVATQEVVNKYAALKTYLNPANTPNFKLGAGVALSDYLAQGVAYRMINSNFNDITLGYEMKHGAVVKADGKLDLTNVTNLLKAAQAAGVSVYGHTLAWHANQNAAYLNSLLLTGVDFDPTDKRVNYANGSFEQNQTGWNSWGGNSTRDVINTGLVGTKSLRFTHTSKANAWDAQIALDFSPAPIPVGDYTLSFFVRSDAPGKFRCSTVGTGSDVQYQPDVITSTTWQYVEWDIKSAGTLSALRYDMGTTPGTYYLDEVRLNPKSTLYKKPVILQLNADEKARIIGGALDKWISEMVTQTKSYVKAWNVVNEPMDDAKPNTLKTAAGRAKIATDEFFWQDYLGKDYAVRAFKQARQSGNPNDVLFINDYNLEYDLDKCRGLIEYVNYIESKGATVDGIGTQLHMSLDTKRENIDQMFKLLAATGKLIKISEMDISIGNGIKTAATTPAQYKAQADLYEYVIKKYMELVPAKQRYGITMWSPMDSADGAAWRAGEPIGLWRRDYSRKQAYGGFANGLAGRDVSVEFK